jgi:hypothetical protein
MPLFGESLPKPYLGLAAAGIEEFTDFLRAER